MGKRGPKPKFTDVARHNEDYQYFDLAGKGNVIANGTYQIKGKRIRKYRYCECGRVFCDRTNTFFMACEKKNQSYC